MLEVLSIFKQKKEIQGLYSSTKDPSVQVLQLAEADEAPAVIPVIANPVVVELAVAATEDGIRRTEVASGVAPAAVVVGDACVISSRLILHHPGGERGRMTSETLGLEVLTYFIRRDLAPRLPDERLESLATAADDFAVETLEHIPFFVVRIDVGQVATSFCEGDDLVGGEVGNEDDVRRPIFGRLRIELPLQRHQGPIHSLGRHNHLRKSTTKQPMMRDRKACYFFLC